MTKVITDMLKYFGIKPREEEKTMTGASKPSSPSIYCIECNAIVTHYGAHFCKLCAMEFYNEDSIYSEDKEEDG